MNFSTAAFWALSYLFLAAQDFDIIGVWDTMVPDAEIISLLSTVLSRIDVGEYTIKVCIYCFRWGGFLYLRLAHLVAIRLITAKFSMACSRSVEYPMQKYGLYRLQ